MSDLVTRLRNWRNVHLARVHLLMDEAADEMERLSKTGHCPVPDDAAEQDNVGKELAHADEIERLRRGHRAALTDAEREAVERAIDALHSVDDMSAWSAERDGVAAATLRGLLERMA